MRVLVADDDPVTRTILGAALKQWNFEVTVVGDGQAAWTALLERPPTLAIFDWEMPGMDGPELCRRLRQEPSLAHLYVILLTSRDDSADLVRGLEAGADDYLTKPFDRDELRARINAGKRIATLNLALAERVVELQTALRTVQQLEGLLPICAYCKRIRSAGDSWEQMESYISHRSKAEFSHGVCPTCLDRLTNDPT